jgi:hypothetical protein
MDLIILIFKIIINLFLFNFYNFKSINIHLNQVNKFIIINLIFLFNFIKYTIIIIFIINLIINLIMFKFLIILIFYFIN